MESSVTVRHISSGLRHSKSFVFWISDAMSASESLCDVVRSGVHITLSPIPFNAFGSSRRCLNTVNVPCPRRRSNPADFVSPSVIVNPNHCINWSMRASFTRSVWSALCRLSNTSALSALPGSGPSADLLPRQPLVSKHVAIIASSILEKYIPYSALYRRNLVAMILTSSMDDKRHLRKAGSTRARAPKETRLDANVFIGSYRIEPNIHLRRGERHEGTVSEITRNFGGRFRHQVVGIIQKRPLTSSSKNLKIRTIAACRIAEVYGSDFSGGSLARLLSIRDSYWRVALWR